jgi:membrane fusion protein, multidrug efflux system
MRSPVIGLFAICGMCALAVQFAGCGAPKKSVEIVKKNSADSSVVHVVVAEVKEASFEDWGSYSADLRGVEDANLTAPFQGGRVNFIKPIGSHVAKGESLCDIDGEKYEAALEAAKAQVEVAKGELERAKINVEKGSIGRSALDIANLAYQNARMAVATAQRAYEDSHCEAPFDGVLVSRSIEKFQTVSPGVSTVRLSKIDRIEAVISISETEAFNYSDGMKTEFKLLQNPDRVYIGKLKSIDMAVDQKSRTATARIELSNTDGSLKPGMVGRARILRKTYTKAVVVPTTALLRLQNGTSAMVVENGIAVQRNVDVAIITDNIALIRSGLKPGDILIISGAFQVSNGTRVQF